MLRVHLTINNAIRINEEISCQPWQAKNFKENEIMNNDVTKKPNEEKTNRSSYPSFVNVLHHLLLNETQIRHFFGLYIHLSILSLPLFPSFCPFRVS